MGGTVTGPASSTDTAIALWNGTSGTVIQDSVVTVDSSGNVRDVANLYMSGEIGASKITCTDGVFFDSELGLGSGGGAFNVDSSGNLQAITLTGPQVAITAGGTADALTATYPQFPAALVDGLTCVIVPTADNTTTTPTFSPNGATAYAITKRGGAALVAGDILNLAPILLEYNDANTRWELLNPASAGSLTLTGDVTGSGVGSVATTIKSSVALAGSPTTTTQSAGDNSTKIATTAYVDAAAATGGAATYQYLTSGSGATYTRPTGCKAILVRMIGAGGGGAGTSLTNAANGSNGADTIFNSIHAKGGTGAGNASYPTAGGAGGTGGTGSASLRIKGGAGGPADTGGGNNAAEGGGGSGGSGPFGGAGSGNVGGSAGIAGATNSGAGGSGGCSNATYYSGGGGGSGEYAEIYISSPSSTYTYTIGAAGAGGTGSSFNGAAGGSGLIIVTEYY